MNDATIECFRRAYAEFDRPVDVLAVDPSLREQFARRLATELGETTVDADWAVRELLRTRKRGQLPRLRRSP